MAGTTTVIVMGVSGSGKTTVAQELARRQGWVFAEGDDFHPEANVAKMRQGIPLDDEDRWPWLRTIAAWIREHERSGTSTVVTCSALKRSYRDLLREGNASVRFAHVAPPEAVIAERIGRRRDHYMPPSLLPSQLQALQPLADDEPGLTLDTRGEPAEVVTVIQEWLGAPAAGTTAATTPGGAL